MRKYVYWALTVIGIALTAWAVGYAYEDRGYWAVGSEYAFLLLPLLGYAAECWMRDAVERRGERWTD